MGLEDSVYVHGQEARSTSARRSSRSRSRTREKVDDEGEEEVRPEGVRRRGKATTVLVDAKEADEGR